MILQSRNMQITEIPFDENDDDTRIVEENRKEYECVYPISNGNNYTQGIQSLKFFAKCAIFPSIQTYLLITTKHIDGLYKIILFTIFIFHLYIISI